MYYQLPSHLASPSASGILANQPVAQFELGSQRNFVYALLDWSEPRLAALIDPQRDLDTPLRELKLHGFSLTTVLLTHSHSDHTAGVPALLEQFPNLTVHVHAAEMKRMKKHGQQDRFVPVSDGSRIAVGDHEVMTIHTPGHSAGECCYLLRTTTTNFLFTGDMLFIGDCGRTDLDSGDTQQMFDSLQKLRALAKDLGDAIVLPGHHYAEACASTLQRELQFSPPFQCRSLQDLQRLP